MKVVDFFLIVVAVLFGASLFYALSSMLNSVAVSAYRLGCASVEAPMEVIEKCKAQAWQVGR